MNLRILPLLLAASAALYAGVPHWRAIFSNDTTNIFNCKSPYNPKGDDTRFDEAMLRASVDEAAVEGVGAQLLQPGHGWVAWWPSKLVPLAEHEAWFRRTFNTEPSIPVHKYLLAGNDLIAPFIDACHKRGVAALISYRVNDNHHLEWVVKGNPKGYTAHAISKFYVDHPEYRVKPPQDKDATLAKNRVHNWLYPEARAYKLALIGEMLDTYPELDGLELDFLRFPNYFPEGTPAEKRVAVMSDFIARVRAKLDGGARPGNGNARPLGVRVPIDAADWENIGFEPAAWRAAGVDFFNLSPSYRMVQKMSVDAVRKSAPDAAIYLELTHTAQTWKFGGPGYDDHCWRRNTREMLENTARIAYAQGADGVSFFNFVYYRAHGGYLSRKGPFDEPPFSLISELADKKRLEGADGYFFLACDHERFAPQTAPRDYVLHVLPARGNGTARLRLQVLTDAEAKNSEVEPPESVDRGKWRAWLNGKALENAAPLSAAYPYPTPYAAGFGYPEQYVDFAIPQGMLRAGANTVTIDHPEGIPLRLRWIEIAQPALDKK